MRRTSNCTTTELTQKKPNARVPTCKSNQKKGHVPVYTGFLMHAFSLTRLCLGFSGDRVHILDSRFPPSNESLRSAHELFTVEAIRKRWAIRGTGPTEDKCKRSNWSVRRRGEMRGAGSPRSVRGLFHTAALERRKSKRTVT